MLQLPSIYRYRRFSRLRTFTVHPLFSTFGKIISWFLVHSKQSLFTQETVNSITHRSSEVIQ